MERSGGRAEGGGQHRPCEKHPPVSSIGRALGRKSGKKQGWRRRGITPKASRSGTDRSVPRRECLIAGTSSWGAPAALGDLVATGRIGQPFQAIVGRSLRERFRP